MSPRDAAERLRQTLDKQRKDFTVADAAAASGLALRDAESGLHLMVSEAKGHLRVTDDGDILYRFPNGLQKAPEAVGPMARFGRALWNGVSGAARFIVRAWVSIVLVAYVLIFVAIILALTFSKSEDRDSGRSFSWIGGLFRLVAEALFWTMHPFSPFYVDTYEHRPATWQQRRQVPEVPFYERVDRFFFGPKETPPDPSANVRAVLAEIRAGKGRIGLADVMRVTGLPRDEADPMMSKLMLDYSGSVEVSEEGGIAYRFPQLRRTLEDPSDERRPSPVWTRPDRVPAITGNSSGTNLLIGGLNLFNLVASGWVLLQGLTVERIFALLTGVAADKLPAPGLPIALGLVPFIFSVALFLLPLGRMALRGRKARAVARENGRRAVLQGVLENAKTGVSDEELKLRYRVATGTEPKDAEITKHVVALGGDVDLDRAGEGVRYRFKDLELEAKAVEAEREAASEEEARVGKVVFSSED